MDRDVTLYPSCTRMYVPSNSSSRGDENWGDDISKEERMVEKRAPSKSCVLPPVLLLLLFTICSLVFRRIIAHDDEKNCTEKLKRWTTVNETLRRPLCDGRRQKFERGRNRQNSSRDECPPVPFLSSPLSPVYRGRNKVNTTALFSDHAAFPDEGGGKKNKGRRSLEDRKWRRLGWLKGGRKVVAAGRQ